MVKKSINSNCHRKAELVEMTTVHSQTLGYHYTTLYPHRVVTTSQSAITTWHQHWVITTLHCIHIVSTTPHYIHTRSPPHHIHPGLSNHIHTRLSLYPQWVTATPQCIHTGFLIYFNNCIVPLGFLPWEIWVGSLGKASCNSCPTQPTMHAGCFSLSISHWTLTWTAGSLTCVSDFSVSV